jgi:hypothetical protein
VLFNAEISWTSGKTRELLDLQESGEALFLMPVLNDLGEGLGSFHKKGLAEVGGLGHWVFSAANLTNSAKSKLVELVLSDRSQAVSAAMAQNFAQDLQRMCSHKRAFDCYLATSFNDDDALKSFFNDHFDKTCKTLGESQLKGLLKSEPQKMFALGPTTSLSSLYIDFAERSKKTLLGVAHKVSDPQILETFGLLKLRSVQLDIGAFWFENPTTHTELVRKVANNKGLAPHSKFLIRDQKRILWGSANMTPNGLNMGTEMAFVSDSNILIQRATEFMKQWINTASQDSTAQPGFDDHDLD